MEPSKYLELSKTILETPEKRFCEIYKITNLTTNKIYVGQAVSHILNHKKYRPYGHLGRFKCHISEAFSTKKNQSHYLNNAIRKYGVCDFEVDLLEYCKCEDADDREIYYISMLNSLFPNGYNLKNGGSTFTHSEESKKRLSKGVSNYYKAQRFQKFKDVEIVDKEIDTYIRPLRRHKIQYGWYVYIKNIKTDFGGVHINLDDSYKQAKEFIEILKSNQLAKHLDAGNSLEP